MHQVSELNPSFHPRTEPNMNTKNLRSDVARDSIGAGAIVPERRGLRLARTTLLAVLIALGMLLSATTPASASLAVIVVNTDGQGIASRSLPLIGATNGYGAPAGAAVVTNCWAWGDAVGPYANRLWWLISYAGRQFYAADRYLSTPNAANQPPPGQPQCGSTPPPLPPPPPAPSSGDTRIWVGAPFGGTWVPITSDCPGATWPSPCSLPAVHHWLSSAAAPIGDWAADLGAPAGTAATVYAAPQNSAMPVKAIVDRVAPACGSGNVADGGYAVTVAFYTNGTRVGSATYAHINPTVSAGATISRWGTKLGTVGQYRYLLGNGSRNGCWQGPHLHFQLYSEHNYACYNRNWSPGNWMSASNFLGFTGGNVASGPRRACT